MCGAAAGERDRGERAAGPCGTTASVQREGRARPSRPPRLELHLEGHGGGRGLHAARPWPVRRRAERAARSRSGTRASTEEQGCGRRR